MSEELAETPVVVTPEETPVIETPADVSPEETSTEETTDVVSEQVEETVTEEAIVEETVAEETVAEETAAEEVVAEEAAAEEAVAEEVVAEEAVVEEVVVEETATEASPVAVPTNLEELTPKMNLNGVVNHLELYGAFVDIGVGTNALIHISQINTKHVNRVADVLTVGQEIVVWVKKVDLERGQVMLSMIEPLAVDWRDLKVGNAYTGKISRLEAYGAFVNIGAEREGLVHISELSHNYVKLPSELFAVGDEVKVQVLGFSKRKRRIDLSIKALQEKPELTESINRTLDTSKSGTWEKKRKDRKRNEKKAPEVFVSDYQDSEEQLPTAMEVALRSAMGNEAIDAITPTKQEKGRNRRKKDKPRSKQQADIISRTLDQAPETDK